MSSQSPIGKLPVELFQDIAARLDLRSLTKLSQVCKSANHVVRPYLDKAARARALPGNDVYDQHFAPAPNGGARTVPSQSLGDTRERLVDAIRTERRNVVESYLKAGVDPNSYSLGGTRLLTIAIWFNHPQILDLLLAYGANPSLSDVISTKPLRLFDTRPPILYATQVRSPHNADYMARRLILAGADLSVEGAIHSIVQHCSLATLRTAVARGADLHQRDSNGSTALHHVGDDKGKLDYILRQASDLLPMTTVIGETALFPAIRTEDESIALSLFEAYVNTDPGLLNIHTDFGETVLHFAIGCNMESLAIKLIQSGITLDHVGSEGTELHYAVQSDMPSVVRLLIARGVDVNYADARLDPPLYLAMKLNNRRIVRILLEEGRASMNVAGPTLRMYYTFGRHVI